MSAVSQKTSRRETRTLVMVIVINVAIIVVIGAVVAAWFLREEWTYYPVGDYDLDQGRLIKIVGEQSSRSHAINLRYEVTAGNKVVLSRDSEGARFYSSSKSGEFNDPRAFTVVPADQGDLIAITDRMRYDDIVILHDFRRNQSWPAHGKDEAVGLAAGRAMLLRLQQEYPFFTCSALSTYRPKWAWSPRLTHWAVTYPDETSGDSVGATQRLAIRVYNTRTQRSRFIQTEISIDDFNAKAAIGWMGNERVVLAVSPDRIYAWKIDADAEMTASVAEIDQSVKVRATELLASPHSKETFAIPAQLLVMPKAEPPVSAEKSPTPPPAPVQNPPAK